MLDKFKNLGEGLVKTLKNTADKTQKKTDILKQYYLLADLIVKDYKSGKINLEGEIKDITEKLVLLVDEFESNPLIDEGLINSFNDIKEEIQNKNTREEKGEEDTKIEKTIEKENIEKDKVKEEGENKDKEEKSKTRGKTKTDKKEE